MTLLSKNTWADKAGNLSLATAFAAGSLTTGAATLSGPEIVAHLANEGYAGVGVMASALSFAGGTATVAGLAYSAYLYKKTFASPPEP